MKQAAKIVRQSSFQYSDSAIDVQDAPFLLALREMVPRIRELEELREKLIDP